MKVLHFALFLAILYTFFYKADGYISPGHSYAYSGSFESASDALYPADAAREQPVFKDQNVSGWPEVLYTPHMALMVPGVKKVPEY